MRGLLVVLVTLMVALSGCRRNGPSPLEQAPPGATPGLDPGLRVAVDLRIELVSIVCRLAGYPEYAESRTPYARAVDAHFGRFKDHPAVAAAATLRADHGIGFNAPIGLVAYLDDALAPIRPLVPAPADLDRRWGEVDGGAFATQLQAFARDSGFAAFVAAHADDHRRAEAALAAALDGYRLVEWFDARFGARPGVRVLVVPTLLAGNNNYAATATYADGRRDVVLSLAPTTAGGYRRSITYTVAHELAHTYVNEPLDAREATLAAAATAAWSAVRARMEAQHYGTVQAMVDESAVRALVVSFARERGPAGAGAFARRNEERRGFAWIAPLTDAIDRLERPIGPDALATAVRDVLDAWARRR